MATQSSNPIRVEVEGLPPMEFEAGTAPDVIQRVVKEKLGQSSGPIVANPGPPVKQPDPPSWLSFFPGELAKTASKAVIEDAPAMIGGAAGGAVASAAGLSAAPVALAGATVAGGAEAGRQLLQHGLDPIRDKVIEFLGPGISNRLGLSATPTAPQTSGEALSRIAKAGSLGLFQSAGKAAEAAFPRAAEAMAQRQAGIGVSKLTPSQTIANRQEYLGGLEGELATKETALDKNLLSQQEAARSEIVAGRAKAGDVNLAIRQGTADQLRNARRATQQNLQAAKQASEQAQLAIKNTASEGAKEIASKDAILFGPKTDFPKTSGILIDQRRNAIKSRVTDLYTKFREEPESQQPFDMSGIKAVANELGEATAASPPPIVRKVLASEDSVPLSLAESFLSELKSAARPSQFMDRNTSQGIAAKITNELYPQIDKELEGSWAGAYLHAGRNLRRLQGDVFQRGVAPRVSKALREGGSPLAIASNPVKLESFAKQAGPEGLPALRRTLLDSAFEKSVNPQSGEFDAGKFATEFNKFRKSLTPDQIAVGDSLAKKTGSDAIIELESQTARELASIKQQSESVTRAIQNSSQKAQLDLSKRLREGVRSIGEQTRASRLETKTQGEAAMNPLRDEITETKNGLRINEKAGMSLRDKVLIAGAGIGTVTGASIVAARIRALRSIFSFLDGEK